MGQHGKDGLASGALNAPDSETTEPNTGIMRVADQTAAAVTGRFVGELKADGEDVGEDKLDKRFTIAQQREVGGSDFGIQKRAVLRTSTSAGSKCLSKNIFAY